MNNSSRIDAEIEVSVKKEKIRLRLHTFLDGNQLLERSHWDAGGELHWQSLPIHSIASFTAFVVADPYLADLRRAYDEIQRKLIPPAAKNV